MSEPATRLEIGKLVVLVHGYQFPEAESDWDANWLVISASIESEAARVAMMEPCLTTGDFAGFLDQLVELENGTQDRAELRGLEPNLSCEIWRQGSRGQLAGRVVFRPEPAFEETHVFDLGLDLSYLPGIRVQIARILHAFPVWRVGR